MNCSLCLISDLWSGWCEREIFTSRRIFIFIAWTSRFLLLDKNVNNERLITQPQFNHCVCVCVCPRNGYCKKFDFITECPPASDGMERFACPTPDRQGRYHCIDDHVLCDGFIDCPSGEDEDRQDCMFYKTVSRFTFFLCNPIGWLNLKYDLCRWYFRVLRKLKLRELPES